jgi:hypothetical protein
MMSPHKEETSSRQEETAHEISIFQKCLPTKSARAMDFLEKIDFSRFARHTRLS